MTDIISRLFPAPAWAELTCSMKVDGALFFPLEDEL